MKALLIYPDAPEIFFNLRHTLDVLGKGALMPPVGLLTVAALLPRSWQKRFVDLQVRDLSDDDIAWADIVLISLTAANVQDDSALRAISRCKAAGLRIVAGGPGWLNDEESFAAQRERFAAVDHFVLGEAEVTLPGFLEDLEAGEPRRVYGPGGRADMADTPVPMFELLEDLDAYMQMGVQLIRGCPYSCDFCLVPVLMGRPGRAKDARHFLDELQLLYQLGWRGFVEINDDNLIADIKFTKNELLPALVTWQRERGMPFRFHVCVDCRVGEDDELLRLLFEAGFHSLFLGIENLNEECLSEVGKTVNRGRDMAAIVRRIHEAGILVYCGLMVGFDGDDASVFEELVDFVERAGIIMPSLTKVNAMPGTPLYERLSRQGRIDRSVATGHAHHSNVVGQPMGKDVLDAGYARAMGRLWDPERFYRRVRRVLEQLPKERHAEAPRPADLLILLRILLYVGVLGGPDRRHFWKLLAWTAYRRPELLPVFFSAPPLGHGFRRRCEEALGIDFGAPRPAPRSATRARTLHGGNRDGRIHTHS